MVQPYFYPDPSLMVLARGCLDSGHGPDGFPHRFCRLHGRPSAPLPVQVQLCVAPVEGLVRIGCESSFNHAERGPPERFRTFPDQGVEHRGTIPGDIPDIGNVLQAAFDLEGADSCPGKVAKPFREVVVLE